MASRKTDLKALRNMIAEAETILTTTTLPQGRAERARELLGTAIKLADHLLTETPAARVIAARQLRRFADKEPVVTRCPECGEAMEGRHQNYDYRDCGLKNVVLLDVLVFNCKCGAIVPEIPAVSMLHRYIAFELIRKPTLLSGEEVRFLRKSIGQSSAQLADLIGITNISLSRWENEHVRITRNADRVLRLLFFTTMVEHDMRTVNGDDGEDHVGQIVAVAKKVESLNLTTFLRGIRAVHERHLIRVDPALLAEFGQNERVLHNAAITELIQ